VAKPADASDGVDHRRACRLLQLDEAYDHSRKTDASELKVSSFFLSFKRIQENCEPALCTVLFMAAPADRCARASRQPGAVDALGEGCADARHERRAPVYVAGRGITFMVDVTRLPAGAFGMCRPGH